MDFFMWGILRLRGPLVSVVLSPKKCVGLMIPPTQNEDMKIPLSTLRRRGIFVDEA
jgi:hypothetical protein